MTEFAFFVCMPAMVAKRLQSFMQQSSNCYNYRDRHPRITCRPKEGDSQRHFIWLCIYRYYFLDNVITTEVIFYIVTCYSQRDVVSTFKLSILWGSQDDRITQPGWLIVLLFVRSETFAVHLALYQFSRLKMYDCISKLSIHNGRRQFLKSDSLRKSFHVDLLVARHGSQMICTDLQEARF